MIIIINIIITSIVLSNFSTITIIIIIITSYRDKSIFYLAPDEYCRVNSFNLKKICKGAYVLHTLPSIFLTFHLIRARSDESSAEMGERYA